MRYHDLVPKLVRLDAAALERVLIDALDVQPNAKLTVEDDWVQLTTPGSKFVHHNVVMRARLSPSEVDARIAERLGFRRVCDGGFHELQRTGNS